MDERTRLDFTGPEIDDILEGIESHVSFVIEQETDAIEKAQARSNIGAQEAVDAVETVEQDRTDAERARARTNIGAVTLDAINEVAQTSRELDNTLNNKIDFIQAQELSAEQHRQAQENLGLHIQEKTSKMILPVGRDNDGKLWTYDISKPLSPDTWEDVGKILERGLAPKYWEPGDQLKVKKTIGSTTEELIFDILGFDYDTPIDANVKHTMSLAMHSVYSYNEIPFDQAEATFYFANGLPAGIYTYKYNDTDYSFMLTTGWSPNTQILGSIDKLIPYIKGALDASDEEIPTVTAVTEGTSLGTAVNDTGSSTTLIIDGVNYPVEMNACYRITYGSNRWETSSARQYLNSNAAGAASGQIASWWTPQTGFDRPTKSTKPGFLYGIEQGFLDLLVDVKKRTRLFNAGDVTGTYKDSDEKVFFLSQTEINLNMEDNVIENSFGTDRTFTNILTTPYPLYVGAGNADRIKYQGSTARYWWLRSPNPSTARYVHRVYTDGSLGNGGASYSYGIVPALCVGR